jgi:tRNA A-37 threonylcarbamoyl transferase component Bud32
VKISAKDAFNFVLHNNCGKFENQTIVYNGLYSKVYKVFLPDLGFWAAAKVFLDGSDDDLDIPAAQYYGQRSKILSTHWPDTCSISHPKVYYDFSSMGVIVMEWIEADPFSDLIGWAPVKSALIDRVGSLSALWLANFHAAFPEPPLGSMQMSFQEVCNSILNDTSGLLPRKELEQIGCIIRAGNEEMRELCEVHHRVSLHGDFGIHNILVSNETCYGIDYTWDNPGYSFTDIAFIINAFQRKLLFKGSYFCEGAVNRFLCNFCDVYNNETSA